jgi:PPOX class probable F420-dependent enzyme
MAVSALEELPSWARGLLERSRVARLSYLDDRDHPRVVPVTYACSGGVLWTAIDGKPKEKPPGRIARVRYLRRCPRGALCVDHYSDDWSELAWVQALGQVRVVGLEETDAEGRPAVAALTAKYERYKREPPEGPLLGLAPERILSWRATDG